MKKKNLLTMFVLSLGLSAIAIAKPVAKDRVMEVITPTDGSGDYYECKNPGSNCEV